MFNYAALLAHTAQAKAFAPLFAYSGIYWCYNVLNFFIHTA